MRLALTHATCWPEVRRGAERILHELALALAGRGHRVTVWSGARSGAALAGLAPGSGRRRGLDGVEHVTLARWRRDVLAHEADFGRRLLPSLLVDARLHGRYDAVHAHGRPDACAALSARSRGAVGRVVFTDLGLPARWWWDAQAPAIRAGHERVAAGVDVYGGMSRYAVDLLASDYDRYDGVITPGGVNLAELSPRPRSADPVLLFSGAVTEPRKGVPTMLAALPQIAAAEPDVRIWLSGPADESVLSSWIAEHVPAGLRDRVEWLGLGPVDGQAERYGRAWATVLDSTDDSFGQCLIESLACGTPLVTSDHAAPPELVDEGVTGSVCPPNDVEAFAAAALRVLSLARAPETTDACRSAALPYAWPRIAERYEALYAGP